VRDAVPVPLLTVTVIFAEVTADPAGIVFCVSNFTNARQSLSFVSAGCTVSVVGRFLF
jgi:hypothetical protein